MSNTGSQATVPVKPKFSSSLKERLKRCGRYHASPEPVARQPKISSVQEKTKNDSTISDVPVSPCAKRQCIDRSHEQDSTKSTSLKSPIMTGSQVHKSPFLSGLEPHKSNTSSLNLEKNVHDKVVSKNQAEMCSIPMNQTPLSQRSRSCVLNVRGSKLNFEDMPKENIHEEQNTEDNQSVSSDNKAVRQLSKCDLVKPKLDVSESMSRAQLLKEIEVKEEQLRKLRMVRMYRTKNNLEELQTLIDKWRDISQQALQDLHEAMPEPRPSLTELINHLGVDHQLVHFSAEDDETFY